MSEKNPAAPPIPPFTTEKVGDSWAVIDAVTGIPAEVDGYVQVGLDRDDADVLSDALNQQAGALLRRFMAGRSGSAS